MSRRVRLATAFFLGVIVCAGGFWLLRTPLEEDRKFTDSEIAILSIPKSDPDGKRKNLDLIRSASQAARTISIRDCILDPVVPKLVAGEEFELRNDDQVPRAIEIDRDHILRVPAGGSLRTVADFGFGKGLYGCKCDENPSSCGIFWVD